MNLFWHIRYQIFKFVNTENWNSTLNSSFESNYVHRPDHFIITLFVFTEKIILDLMSATNNLLTEQQDEAIINLNKSKRLEVKSKHLRWDFRFAFFFSLHTFL